MAKSDHGTRSIWAQTDSLSRTSLKTDLEVDVCIVGAGIAGLTTAYALLKNGLSVCVLEARDIAEGQTERTSAHISAALEERYSTLEKYHGPEAVKKIFESHTGAIDRFEEIIFTEKIDCEWKRLSGYLFLSPTETPEVLEKELDTLQRAGIQSVESLERAPLTAFNSGPCLHFPRQASLHATKYIRGLVSAIERLGGKIYTQTRVEKVQSGKLTQVTTQNGNRVITSHLVVATNSPINDFAVIHTKQAPYRTYVVAGIIPHGSVKPALYWDTHDPYHYIRIEEGQNGKDYLLIGGEDHKTGQESHPENCFSHLELWAKEHFPMIESFEYRWSGQCMETVDGIAFIGRNPADLGNVYIITGDSGNGLTHSTLGAYLIKDLILGNPNELETVYSPSRFRARSARTFIKENLNSVSQYLDWITPGDVNSTEELKDDHGGIMRDGSVRIAAYRSKDGKVHQCSAVCPHMGAIVSWNNVEKTWDCPCHGSRFNPYGEVIEGPSTSNLLTK